MSKSVKQSRNKGFTLIELMVVVSIIAILSVIGVTAFSSAQKQGRDAKRRADIDAIAKALESNRDGVAGTYKPSGLSITTAAGYNGNATFNGYFSSGTAPKDPTNDNTTGLFYKTQITTSDTIFMTCAKLEGPQNGNATSNTGAGIGTTSTGTHFCMQNQQ